MLQKEITDLKLQLFHPPQSDHTEIDCTIWTLTVVRDKARVWPIAPGTEKEVWEKLAAMTRDAQQSGGKVRGLRKQLVNGLTLAA